MEWKMLPTDELIKKLAPKSGMIDMVLDTDTYNEVDDQFALCYSLLSPERLNVQAVYAAPFWNNRSKDPGEGMKLSYDEIVRLMAAMGKSNAAPVFEGSMTYLPDGETPVDSPAARDLIARAMQRSDDDPLYVVAIGAITNVASALLLEPKIVNKIVIVWLGGHPTSFHSAQEFNLAQDVPAARVIFDCGAPVVLVPCMGVASHLLTSVPELKEAIGGKNAICDALLKLFSDYEENNGAAWAKEIWDVSTIGYLINPDWLPSVLTHSPMLTDDCRWAMDKRRHLIREVEFCRRNPIFRDMFEKLSNC